VNESIRALLAASPLLVLVVMACGGSTRGPSAAPGDDSGSVTPESGTDDGGGTQGRDASSSDASSRGDGPEVNPLLDCSADPPQGAPQAAPLPTYAGQCPMLVAAPTENMITSSGNARQFLLAIPANLKPTEKLPVVFMWHWLGGSGSAFYTIGEIQQAVDQQRFLAVMPEKKGDVAYTWPFSVADSDARMAEEFQFFDDMLACVAHQFPTVNKNCVATAGVSAGALFTDQLAAARADHVSSFLSMSGGVGGVVRPWGNPAHKLPGIVLWGGPTDNCQNLLSFQTMSQTLESSLTSDGDFMIECVHNCGHAEPPVDPPMGESKLAPFWGFIFDHPFWMGAGQSPYLIKGLPSSFPSWCAIGAGKATPRTGMCPTSSGC
jgi:predicted esterase